MTERVRVFEVGGPDNDDFQFADGYKVLIHVHFISGQNVGFFVVRNTLDYQATRNITGHTRSMAVQGDPHTMTPTDEPRRVEIDGKYYDISVESIGSETKNGRAIGFCVFAISHPDTVNN